MANIFGRHPARGGHLLAEWPGVAAADHLFRGDGLRRVTALGESGAVRQIRRDQAGMARRTPPACPQRSANRCLDGSPAWRSRCTGVGFRMGKRFSDRNPASRAETPC